MGRNKYLFMENSKKIIALILFVVLFTSCQGGKNNKGYEVHQNEKKQIVIDGIVINKVKKTNGVIVSINEIIDEESFQNLNTSVAYIEGVKNEYYISNPIDNYFIDNNYIYMFYLIYQKKNPL